jgi:hypothetical protein
MSPKEKLALAVAAGAVGGILFHQPGALIGAWAAASYTGRKDGLKKIAINGGIGTVAGVVVTKLMLDAVGTGN